METVKFDIKQKKDGTNKFGHYQFGTERCQYCKGNTVIPGTIVCEQCINYKKIKNA